MVLWNGLFVREGTPQEAVDKIEAAVTAALATEKARTYAAENGVPLYWKPAAEAREVISADTESFKVLTGQ
jgi:tripartite-type tricarboxylate transporter receptor subunit TctC